MDAIDISHFPKWSRGWYNSNNSSKHHLSHIGADVNDIYTPIPPSRFNSSKNAGYAYDSYGSPPPPISSLGHESSRDLLPWSMDPPEYGPPLDPVLKEERMRMLEQEFGSKGNKDKGTDFGRDLMDDDGKPLIGTVDAKGNLVTPGPKRRILIRILELVLAAGACIPAIYAAVVRS